LQPLDNLNDFESVSFLLKGLGSDYDLFVTSVTTRVDPLSIDELYGHLLAHEMRLEQQISFAGSHGPGSYFPSDASSASRPTCQICGKFGHIAARCCHRQDTSFTDQQQPPSPHAYYSTPVMLAEKVWYLDTGATHHITNDLQHLILTHEDYHRQDEIWVGNGTSLPVSHIGSASLNLSRCQFILKQLLRVPSICKNLLSVKQFALDNSVFFEFHSSYFVIKDSQTWIILHQGRINDGLYQLLPSPCSSSIKQALVGERTSANSWHKRLSHPAFRTVQTVIS
jgi:hypothetical protein